MQTVMLSASLLIAMIVAIEFGKVAQHDQTRLRCVKGGVHLHVAVAVNVHDYDNEARRTG